MNEESALRNILTGSKADELRHLGAPAYTIRCKWEGWVKKVVLGLRRGEELD
jgi:hypothetical protein